MLQEAERHMDAVGFTKPKYMIEDGLETKPLPTNHKACNKRYHVYFA